MRIRKAETMRLPRGKAQPGLVCSADPDTPKADNSSGNIPFLTPHRRDSLGHGKRNHCAFRD